MTIRYLLLLKAGEELVLYGLKGVIPPTFSLLSAFEALDYLEELRKIGILALFVTLCSWITSASPVI